MIILCISAGFEQKLFKTNDKLLPIDGQPFFKERWFGIYPVRDLKGFDAFVYCSATGTCERSVAVNPEIAPQTLLFISESFLEFPA